jgi:hypothetical protein
VDVVSKIMTPLFFRVARVVAEQYHISKVMLIINKISWTTKMKNEIEWPKKMEEVQ